MEGPFIHADIVFHPDDLEAARWAELGGGGGGQQQQQPPWASKRKVPEVVGTTITRNSRGITMGWRTYKKPGYYWLWLPCTAEQLLLMEEMALGFVDDEHPLTTQFSYTGFIRAGLKCFPQPPPTSSTRSFFCSQYLGYLLCGAGLLDSSRVNPSSLSVTELFITCMDQIPDCWPCECPLLNSLGRVTKFKDAFDCYGQHHPDVLTPLVSHEAYTEDDVPLHEGLQEEDHYLQQQRRRLRPLEGRRSTRGKITSLNQPGLVRTVKIYRNYSRVNKGQRQEQEIFY